MGEGEAFNFFSVNQVKLDLSNLLHIKHSLFDTGLVVEYFACVCMYRTLSYNDDDSSWAEKITGNLSLLEINTRDSEK